MKNPIRKKDSPAILLVTMILAFTGVVTYAPVTTDPTDPLVGAYYSLEKGGETFGFFTSVNGIGSENEIVETKIMTPEGMEKILKIPGRLKYPNLTLKRGLTANMDVWTWRKMVEDGKVTEARSNISVVQYNQEGSEVARWNFVDAWPVSVSFDSEGTLEELVLAYSYCERVL